MHRVTLKDIAQMAGVSTSTVSRALKNHPDISHTVKEKIKLIAENLNFVPNAAAIGLRNKSIKTIGLILPNIHSFFVPSMIEGITSVLNSMQFKLMILTSDEDYEKEVHNIASCIDSGVDGILISLTKNTCDLNHLDKAAELEIPIVLLDKSIHQNIFSEVVIDDYKAGKLCFEYLIDKQVKEILGFFGPLSLNITKERLEGFQDAASLHPKIKTYYYFCDSSLDAKDKCSESMLEFPNADAVFIMSDEVMVGVNAAMYKNKHEKNGCKMTRIAISEGYLPQFMDPPISYLKHDGYKLGTIAAQLLLDQIHTNPAKPEIKILDTTFYIY
ncbi:MAG: LacI family DNA-binding transcriptional regulator [Saprospiraceae bacterium]